MNERKGLSDGPARGALAEGAERFDRIARALTTPPAGEKRSDQSHTIATSPDEVWARNYMTYAIGAKVEPPAVAGFAPVAHLVSMPKFVAPGEPIVPKTAEIIAKAPEAEVIPSGPIGVRIGKPMRRRSWLGRLFLGPA